MNAQYRQRRYRQGGFTLLELLMVLVLVGVLFGLAGPAFILSFQNNRLTATRNDAAANLSLARVEAITRVRPVSLCPTTDLVACGGSNWETGMLMFVDDGAGSGGTALNGQLDGGEELLRIVDPAPPGVTVRTVDFSSTDAIVLRDDGQVLGSAGTVIICDERGAANARGVIVRQIGSIRLSSDPIPGNGVDDIHLDGTGDPLVCP